VTQIDDEARRRAERARRVALLRYELIQEVIDPQLSARQRGVLVRELAAGTHQAPFGGEPPRFWWRLQPLRGWSRARSQEVPQ
jgi:putative transposase